MTMLTPDAARFYGRPVFVGTAETPDEVDAIVGDVREQGRRVAEKARVRVVVFEAIDPGRGDAD